MLLLEGSPCLVLVVVDQINGFLNLTVPSRIEAYGNSEKLFLI